MIYDGVLERFPNLAIGLIELGANWMPMCLMNLDIGVSELGNEVLMFNTDYPHLESGTDPFGDFERSLNAVNATAAELDNFYTKNFEDMMGL